MSFHKRNGWLPAALSLITLAGGIAVAISLVSLSPVELTLDAFAAWVAAHTLGLALLGGVAVASGARALRQLRPRHTAEGWSLSDSRDMHRAA